MPSDIVFGLIQTDLNKIENIVEPEDYYDVSRKHSSFKILGTDWKTKAKQ